MIFDKIEVIQGDIVKQQTDAIVNAANEHLARGSGVCGAIHAAAGPELEQECKAIGRCPTGKARITKGYNLPAKWVIHAVGPVWQGGKAGEAALLAQCYRSSLVLAEKHGIKTIAFPAISTGIYGYPLEEATKIAIDEVKKYLSQSPTLEKVVFVCRDNNYHAYIDYLSKSASGAAVNGFSTKLSTIYFYHEAEVPYGCFSNFLPHGVHLDGYWWPTVEHFFQAQKFPDSPYTAQIRKAASPGDAKKLAWDNSSFQRTDWDTARDAVMRRAVFRKFETHKDIQQILLSTGNSSLVEKTTKDYYWGCGTDGTGQNKLGQILMEVRQLLRDRLEA